MCVIDMCLSAIPSWDLAFDTKFKDSGLTWLTVSGDSIYGLLAPSQEHHGGGKFFTSGAEILTRALLRQEYPLWGHSPSREILFSTGLAS